MAECVDLEDYVTAWAWEIFGAVKSTSQSKIPKENLQLVIDWSKVKFQHGEPEYRDKHISAEPKGQVVFSTTFINDTDAEHEYSFQTERTTKSTCEIQMSKGVTTGVSMGLALKTPCEVFEMNAGFSREVEVTRSEGETIEQELKWSVDSNIKLPEKTKTIANLIINHQEFDGKFKVKSKFWGRMLVCMHNTRDNNNIVRVIDGRVEEIFRSIQGFTISGKVVSYVSEGTCHFRFGVDQQIHLQQLPLDSNSPEKGNGS